MIPVPRKPVCLRHTVWLASCDDCNRQRQAERQRQEA